VDRGLALISLLVLANAFFLAATWFLRHRLGAARMGAVVLACATTLPTMVLDLTFTCVAITVGAAATLALCTIGKVAGRPRAWLTGATVLGFVACASLRSYAIVAIVAVFAPTLVLAATRLGRRSVILVVVATLGILGVTRLADEMAQSSASWSAYNDFNAVRGTLHGARSFELLMAKKSDPAVTAQLTSINWTWDDLELFGEFFYDDPVVYSTARLEAVRDLIGNGTYRSSVDEAVRTVTTGRSQLLLVLLIAITLSLVALGWRGRSYVAVQSVWAAGVFVATAATQRFPDRIAVPLCLGLAMLITLAPTLVINEGSGTTGRKLHNWQVGIATLCLWFSALNVTVADGTYSSATVSRNNDISRARFHRDMFVLDAVDPNGRFVYAGAWVSIEGSDPFDPIGPYEPHRLIGIGWPTFSPLYEARRERLGVPGNLLRALLEQRDLYLVIGFPPEKVEAAYARRLGVDVELAELARLDDGASVYQVRPSP
jgi:hypothetical protein